MPLARTLLFLASACAVFAAANVKWIPSDLPPLPAPGTGLGNYLKPEQGKAVLDAALQQFPDRESWEAYGRHVRQRIQEAAGLSPWPKRTPLNATFRDRRTYDGYTVENGVFESVPGFFVPVTLYRPTQTSGPTAAILCPHGHAPLVKSPADYEKNGRLSTMMQARCGSLARMGAVVLAIDMFAYGDSIQIFGQDAHRQPLAFKFHVWNAMRAVDLLLSLDGVDPRRIGVSGESGGGTQTFMLTLLDPRIAVSMPVVMVSSYFFGGCQCESGLPVHRGPDHFTSNALISALAAPRPQLLVSDGDDWTKHNPEIEFPFLRRIYGYYGAEANVANVHLPTEKHDYGPSKREAVYRFAAAKLGLNLAAVTTPDGRIDESRVTLEKPAALHVFNAEFPIPPNALHDAQAVERVFRSLQQ